MRRHCRIFRSRDREGADAGAEREDRSLTVAALRDAAALVVAVRMGVRSLTVAALPEDRSLTVAALPEDRSLTVAALPDAAVLVVAVRMGVRSLTVAALLVAFVGCAAPRRAWSPTQDPDTLDTMAFLHYLPTVPVVTVDEGCRAVLLLVEDVEDARTFAGRRARLLEHGALRPEWTTPADRVLDLGTLAYMLRVLCDLPPGATEVVLSSWSGLGARRHALRTCVAAGLLVSGAPSDPVSGGALLAALTRAESYRDAPRPDGP